MPTLYEVGIYVRERKNVVRERKEQNNSDGGGTLAYRSMQIASINFS